jgi:hypothetical protein
VAFCQQLDAAREMLDEHTHAIIHLEHHIEQQDLELDERVATIADLEQQFQVHQLQLPPAPASSAAPAEPDVESDVDEEQVVDMLGRQGGMTFIILTR